MQELKKLKLKDIVETPMNVSEMGNLIAGINDGIMPAAYGCESYVCTDNKTNSEKKCTSEECFSITCKSGA